MRELEVGDGGILGSAWTYYCKDMMYKKCVFISSPVIYNSSQNRMIIEGEEYQIESSSTDKMVVSKIRIEYNHPTKIPTFYVKDYTRLVRKDNVNFNLAIFSEDVVFESVRKAEIGLIQLLREQYGDTMKTDLREHPYINLKLYEEFVQEDSLWFFDEDKVKQVNW